MNPARFIRQRFPLSGICNGVGVTIVKTPAHLFGAVSREKERESRRIRFPILIVIPYNCLKSSCFRYIHRVYLPGQQYLNPIKTLFTRIFLFCSTVSFLFIWRESGEEGNNTIGTYIYIYSEFSSFDSSMRANVSPLFVPKRTETKQRERGKRKKRRK